MVEKSLVMAIRIALLMAALASCLRTGEGQMCSGINVRRCADCVSLEGCAWCYEEGERNNHRCQPVVNASATCSETFIANPQSSEDSVLLHEDGNNPVSIVSANLSLRVGDPQSFKVTVTPQRDLPLDLYILMDLSSSMNLELETIKIVASSIPSAIDSITRNVRLGLGAFNDKLVQPFFVQAIPGVCTVEGGCTVNSFAFRHIVNLTDDNVTFNEIIQNLTLTQNVDPPENGLEGLAQVIACEDKIGWRERVDNRGTRVILFMTDNDFHYAGDGKLAGILKPYTGECLMEINPETGFLEYTKYAEYDYPSIGQILTMMTEVDVSTIFAVEGEIREAYQSLDTLLNTNTLRSSIDTFSPNESSADANVFRIQELIRTQYSRLLQDVSLEAAGEATDLRIEFSAACPQGSTNSERGCQNVGFDEHANFTVTVTLTSCNPFEHGQTKTTTVASPSFGSFRINYKIICDCDVCASDAGQQMLDSSICSGNGVMECGVCNCTNNTCGANCDISLEGRSQDCPIGGNGLICSGPTNGVCDCGCVCNSNAGRTISGAACQCNSFECPGSERNGSACSGQGLCCNNQCQCYDSNSVIVMDQNIQNPDIFRHDTTSGLRHCQCPTARTACFGGNIKANAQCSGLSNATCGCNFCDCPDDRQGRYCELIRDDTCSYSKDVTAIRECRKASTSEENIPDVCTCTSCTPDRPYLFVNNAEVANLNGNDIRRFYERVANTRIGVSSTDPDESYQFLTDNCAISDDGCSVTYVIVANATHSAVVVVRERVCQGNTGFQLGVPIWALPIIIIACLLVIGIIIIALIRLIIYILDNIEVSRWRKEARGADFSKNQNPLYQSPETEVVNVAYGRE